MGADKPRLYNAIYLIWQLLTNRSDIRKQKPDPRKGGVIMSELKQLDRLLTQGEITRRDFLARLSALGITAALSPALLTTPAKAATPPKRRAAETRPGRWFHHRFAGPREDDRRHGDEYQLASQKLPGRGRL